MATIYLKHELGNYYLVAEIEFLMEEEYSDVLSGQLSCLDSIYDAVLKSRVGFRGWFAASGINKMRKFEKKYYKEKAEELYTKKRGFVSKNITTEKDNSGD